MVSHRILAPIIVLALYFTVANAQQSPFLFTLNAPDPAGPRIVAHYDAAYGRGTFEPMGGDNLEQTLGMRTALSPSVILSARLGFATTRLSTLSSQHVELLVQAMGADRGLVDLSLGPGFRHEYSGTNVLMGRIIVGRRFSSSQLYGNLLFEKAFAADRDDIDLVFTTGWSYSVSSTIRLGIEAVGQDLEGFWDANEAEGGATLFFGPTIAAGIPETPWMFTLGAGPILRASYSNRTSSALRDLPFSRGNGFVVHAAVSLGL
jgi:hypothetical protein